MLHEIRRLQQAVQALEMPLRVGKQHAYQLRTSLRVGFPEGGKGAWSRGLQITILTMRVNVGVETCDSVHSKGSDKFIPAWRFLSSFGNACRFQLKHLWHEIKQDSQACSVTTRQTQKKIGPEARLTGSSLREVMLTQRRMLPTRACTTTAFLAFVFQSRQYPRHWLMVSMVQEETCSSNR